MSAPVLVACDLDRTLIYSLRSAAVPHGSARRLVCVERYAEREQSFVTEAALAGLVTLAARAVFVPATTRTRAQAARVRFPGLAGPRYQIAANGGLLLVDGEEDRDWTRTVERTLAASGDRADRVWDYLRSFRDEPWLTRPYLAENLFCYAVIDRDALPPDRLAGIAEWTAARGWRTSVQGRKLYMVPRALSKAAAVAELARTVGAGRILAAGDSLLDRSMLAAADAAIRPGDGELATREWTAPHVVALKESGVVAGEMIVDWLLARTGPAPPRGAP